MIKDYITKIKNSLYIWLFKEQMMYEKKIVDDWKAENEKREKELKEMEQKLINDYAKRIGSIDIISFFREKMKGFDPKNVDKVGSLASYQTDVLVEVAEEEGGEGAQDSFLADLENVYKNKAFNRLYTFLVRNQVIITAKEAVDLNEINFGRATVNGLSLFREEIDRLHAVYLERLPDTEQFDKHEVV